MDENEISERHPALRCYYLWVKAFVEGGHLILASKNKMGGGKQGPGWGGGLGVPRRMGVQRFQK